MRTAARLQEIRLRRALLTRRAMSERAEIGAAFAAIGESLAPFDRVAAVLHRAGAAPWSPLLAATVVIAAARGALRSRRVRIWMLLAAARRVLRWLRARRAAV